MQNSIVSYYGLSNYEGIILQSHQFEYIDPIGDNPEIDKLSDVKQGKTLVLFISIRAVTISERIMHPPIIIQQRFGLLCDLLLEHQIKTFEGVVRICAVKVHRGQSHALLKTLFDYSSCSFAIVFDERESLDLLSRLVYLFENGLLTPKVTKACSSTALSENASFLHVLRGNDGYSVNYFSKQQM